MTFLNPALTNRNINYKTMYALILSCYRSLQVRLFIFSTLTFLITAGWTQLNGQFIGKNEAEWINTEEGNRQMKLLNDFGYVDAKGKTWQVASGSLIDESLIPKSLWNRVGSPLTGDYRDAAIVHNYYCKSWNENWYATHEMFYEACLTAGLPQTKAKLLFATVYANVPRWIPHYGKSGLNATTLSLLGYNLYRVSIPEPAFNEVMNWIETTDPALSEIVTRLQCSMKETKEKRLVKPKSLTASVAP
jgi:hypothetical protein